MTEMEKLEVKNKGELRTGYTTGSCAAAAAKVAAWMLLTGTRKTSITINLPNGKALNLPVEKIEIASNSVSCSIKKDSGDDPDITNGIYVTARVAFSQTPGICIDGGAGVGKVTKCGLDQPVGNAAINSVPRRMIEENVREICSLADFKAGLDVVISVPGGEELAKRTFNPRLGIVGGISILGTTGIVEPMSEKALVDTIRVELGQRKASGEDYVLLTPGNYGMEYIKSMGISKEVPVLVSNFIGDALDICAQLGFRGVLITGHIGKLVKLAGGIFNTHSKYGDRRMEIIASSAQKAGADNTVIKEIYKCITCDAAINILKKKSILDKTLELIADRIDNSLRTRCHGSMDAGAILFSKEHGFLCRTKDAEHILKHIVEE